MVVLLDTHALLFMMDNNFPDLRMGAVNTIKDAKKVCVSTVSLYEIGQKIRLGKLAVDIARFRQMPDRIRSQGVYVTDLNEDISIDAALLDWEHRDPFDRLIVATATNLNAKLISRDKAIAHFIPDRVIW